jgi:hypothetical protein
MRNDHLKTPLALSLDRFVDRKLAGLNLAVGKFLPASVVEVVSSGIVTVKFEVKSVQTLPHVTIPLFGPEYVRYPIKVGDKGAVLSFDSELGSLSGLGGGTPNLTASPGNLTALVFLPFGNTNWFPVDPNAVNLYNTDKAIATSGDTGFLAGGPNGNLEALRNIVMGNGVTGSFSTPTGQIVNLQQGLGLTVYPQGLETLINTEYFDAEVDQVNAILEGPRLQTFVTGRINAWIAQQTAMLEQLSILGPMFALVSVPTNPSEVVTWITNYVSDILGPLLVPYNNYIAQVGALDAQVLALVAAMENRSVELNYPIIVPPYDFSPVIPPPAPPLPPIAINNPFGVTFSCADISTKPLNTIVARFPAGIAWTLPATTSTPPGYVEGKVTTGPSANTDFELHVDGVLQAIVRWASGSTTPVLLNSVDIIFAEGDYLDLVSPASFNGMAGAFGLTVMGVR